MKKHAKCLIIFLSTVLLISVEAFANIKIERRIDRQNEDIDDALNYGLISAETADKLHAELSAIQEQNDNNTERQMDINVELMHDLDELQIDIKSAIAYGK